MSRRFVTSDGVMLSYLEIGKSPKHSKRPVVAMVPGWSMPARLWRPQLEGLGDDYHCVALDPRGQGESEVPTMGYTAERRARDLYEFIQLFPQVLVVGWSLGAIESLQFIRTFGAEKLVGLVVVDSSVGEEPAPPLSSDFLAQLRTAREATVRNFCRAIFATERREEEIESLVTGAQRLNLEDSLALLSYPFERSHWKRIVHDFAKPLLYVVTRQFAAQAQNLKRHRPETRIEVFENAGHALFVDEPARFNRLIAEFAASIMSPAF
jgi:non-heme chloroperoxidase